MLVTDMEAIGRLKRLEAHSYNEQPIQMLLLEEVTHYYVGLCYFRQPFNPFFSFSLAASL